MIDTVDVETDSYAVGWNDDIEAVVVEWAGAATGDPYRAGMDSIVDVAEHRQAAKLLGDARTMGLVSDADLRWTVEDWLPRLAATDIQHEAVVYPSDTVAQSLVDEIGRAHVDLPIERLFAHELETAVAWLERR